MFLILARATFLIDMPKAKGQARSQVKRPTGIAILAILAALGGLLLILAGAAIGAFSSNPHFASMVGLSSFSSLIGIASVVFIIIGLLLLAVAYGLWKGAKWAWWLAVILSVLGIISNFLNLVKNPAGAVVGIVIEAIILYYLTRKTTKAYFRM